MESGGGCLYPSTCLYTYFISYFQLIIPFGRITLTFFVGFAFELRINFLISEVFFLDKAA